MLGYLNNINDATEGFYHNIKALGCFKAWFVWVLLGFFLQFLVDPYYEPLAWYDITLWLNVHSSVLTGFFQMIHNLYDHHSVDLLHPSCYNAIK